MEKKNGSGRFAGAFAGKGYNIVLFLCAAAIVASAVAVALDAGKTEEMETAERTVDISDAVVTMLPAGTLPLEEDDAIPTLKTAEAEPPEAAETETPEEPAAEVFSETEVSYVWPVRGPIEQPYAVETLVYDPTMADWRAHDGLDIACDAGAEVLAAAAGTVTRVTEDDLLGTVVEIDHGNGVRSVYGNLASAPPVSEGDRVSTGQIIGSVGSTALAETNMVPHLHLAMTRDGSRIDPRELLPAAETEY